MNREWFCFSSRICSNMWYLRLKEKSQSSNACLRWKGSRITLFISIIANNKSDYGKGFSKAFFF